ncbi:MAG: DUF2344 domain-containing protein [Fretibacterium sp.]|nr:DUF2344 domain-containing protein [Fretibacterium sp.]
MNVRLRLFYEKRGGACFVPHVALAQVFARSARRVGLKLGMTKGFSPRSRMSFGPELPAGVVALCEPVDVYLARESVAAPQELVETWNAGLPKGFRAVNALFPAEGAPSLGKGCREALYHLRASKLSCDLLQETLRETYAEDVLLLPRDFLPGWTSLLLSSPASNGIGRWVRGMIGAGHVEGWQDVNIVRAAIGLWNGAEMELPGTLSPAPLCCRNDLRGR